jgi:hypothetical protein
MNRSIRRTLVAALLGATTALTGVSAAVAAPAARTAPLAITATDLVYGQPDLSGMRTGTNTVSITNRSGATIPAPLLTLPHSSLLNIDHGALNGCPTAQLAGDTFRCWADPLAPGETRDFELGWLTRDRGPGATVPAKVEVAREAGGAPVPRTAARTSWRVSFAPLTGTFDITATELRLAQEADGVWRGTVGVTVTNISAEPVPYPMVRFFTPSEETQAWTDCVSVLAGPEVPACLLAPLAAGETRQVSLVWASPWGRPGVDPTVRVDAAPDATGTAVIEGTGAGTEVRVVPVS